MKELSKNIKVMKSLVETVLQKNTIRNPIILPEEEIGMGLAILSALASDHYLPIMADSDRIAGDFASVIQRNYVHLDCVTKLRGLREANVIVLHSGARTPVQAENYYKILKCIKDRTDLVIWHVGRWR